MDVKQVEFKDTLLMDNCIFVDTRTSSEYKAGHIEGSINLPIFTNEERAEIGYIYKQISKDEAVEKGLEKASKKLPDFFNSLKTYKDKKIIIYCARGGMRSKTIAVTMNLMGLNTYQLKGGFKSYRNYIINYFENYKTNFIVLSGNTGCGKTQILKELIKKNIPAIDLEDLANHRGSIFGDIGLYETETQKNFESKLFHILNKYENKIVYIESESRKIGSISIPNNIYAGIINGEKVKVISSLENRIERIRKDYLTTNYKIDDFISRLEKIKQFMSGENYKKVKRALMENDLDNAIKLLLLNYYDKMYGKNDKSEIKTINSDNLEKCVEELTKNKSKN